MKIVLIVVFFIVLAWKPVYFIVRYPEIKTFKGYRCPLWVGLVQFIGDPSNTEFVSRKTFNYAWKISKNQNESL